MKIGVNLKIDVSKIDKARLFRGEKGVYLDATAFIDLDQLDQYGNSGMITQSWKDQQKGEGAILGNSKVFWRDGGQPAQNRQQQPSALTPQGNPNSQQNQSPQQGGGFDDFDDDKQNVA